MLSKKRKIIYTNKKHVTTGVIILFAQILDTYLGTNFSGILFMGSENLLDCRLCNNKGRSCRYRWGVFPEPTTQTT
jgi:hypothetical protein